MSIKLTENKLRSIIKEEISRINENEELDARKSDDPLRMLADIGRRSETLSKRVRAAIENPKLNLNDDLDELLSNISSELNMYVHSTYKFRHDYKPDYRQQDLNPIDFRLLILLATSHCVANHKFDKNAVNEIYIR